MDVTDPDIWHGGAMALVILAGSRTELRAAAADASIDAVLRGVWGAPGLDGPYARHDVDPDRQPVAAAAVGHEVQGPYVIDYLEDGRSGFAADWLRGTPDGLQVS